MPVDVLTRSYNNQRSGVNLQEMVLKKANVNVNTFGKLFTRSVDGQIYAQPLIVTNVTIKGELVAEVVIVATTRNFVYAFDAQDPTKCDFLWRANLSGPGEVPAYRADFDDIPQFHNVPGTPDIPAHNRGPYRDFTEEIGIISTPVIDEGKKFLYVVAKSKQGGSHFNRLHKLNLETGQEEPGSPQLIQGDVAGTGYRELGSSAGTVSFSQRWQLNRPGLLLANGSVYIAFASLGDDGPYHGWVFRYDADSLQRKAIHCTTPDWGEGGIWQSGSGMAFADGHVYYVAGNGPNRGPTNPPTASLQSPTAGWGFGNTIVKLDANTLAVADWFSPWNTRQLSVTDDDLCSGPVLPDETNVVLGFGKDGFIYVCDRNNLGKFDVATNRNTQAIKITHYHIHGTPLYWKPKRLLYLWSEEDACLGYHFTSTGVTFPPMFSQARFPQLQDPVQMMPGGMLTLSANGDKEGIVWAAHPTDKNANHATVIGTLRAFDADNLQIELWNSDHDPQGSDSVGNFAKFCPPVVANGKVYLATFSRSLVVYGLLGDVKPKPIGPWDQTTIGTPVFGSASESCNRFTVLGSGRDIWNTADSFHFVHQKIASGTTTLSVKVTSVQKTDPWAKAGVMIRESLDPQSPHAMVVMTPGNGIAFQHRDAFGGASMNFNDPAIKIETMPWVRIVREPVAGASGQFLFTGFHSTDGINWLQVGEPVTFGMSADAFGGMAVTAHFVLPPDVDPEHIDKLQGFLNELNMSTFENIKLQ